jgi:hypothetical protein
MPAIRPVAALAVVLTLACAVVGRAEDRFFTAVEDLPVMPGLTERPGSTATFEKPDGRIVSLTADGAVSRDAVLAFYDRVLPQFGWTRNADGSFRRESERLRMAFAKAADGISVRITITPE